MCALKRTVQTKVVAQTTSLCPGWDGLIYDYFNLVWTWQDYDMTWRDNMQDYTLHAHYDGPCITKRVSFCRLQHLWLSVFPPDTVIQLFPQIQSFN